MLTPEKKWVPIRATDVDIDASVTVHAFSGLFQCELCGQKVTLTKQTTKVKRHFRHSKDADEKDCPDRSESDTNPRNYSKLDKHNLPLRIVVNNQSLLFMVGFIRIPEEWYDALSIIITPSSNRAHSFIYNQERFFKNSITYLSVGDKPSSSYELKIESGNKGIFNYWPREIEGVESSGTFFEQSSGLMKTGNSNIVVGKQYYLLINGHVTSFPSSVKHSKIDTSLSFGAHSIWHLYSIEPTQFDSEAVEFFLHFSYRLVEKDSHMETLWPLYKKGPFSILHNQEKMYMHITGEGRTDYFPKTNSRSFQTDNGTIVEFDCLGRQQIVSIGQYKTLAYSYYWKTPLDTPSKKPEILVFDISKAPLPPGDNNSLPPANCLVISSKFSGFVERRRNDVINNKLLLSPSSTLTIDNLHYGEEIRVYIGLDCVWSAHFKKEETKAKESIDEMHIVQQLNHNTRNMVPVPHALKNMALDFYNYPLIESWIQKTISDRVISDFS